MRMPPHDFQPPLDMVIHNGQPVRGDHAATVDEWTMYLASAEGGHPILPTLLTGSVGMVASGRNGWRSNDTDWGDNPSVTIPTIIPPFTRYMQFGVVATGRGQVRVTGPYNAAASMITLVGSEGNLVGDATAEWCGPPGPTGADVNRPIGVTAGGASVVGWGKSSLQNLVFTWRSSSGERDLEMLAVMLRPWPQPYGEILSGLSLPTAI